MRVLHFAHGHPEIRKGGAEIAAYRIHQDLRGREGIHSIFIAAEFPWEMPVPDATFAPGPGPEEYFLASTGFEHFRSSRSDLGVIEATLVPFLLGLRPDVVHFHHYHLLGVELIPLVRRTLPGVKVVVHLHEMYAICPRNGHMFLPESGELCDRAVPSRCAGCFPHEGAANLKLRELFLRSTLDQADLFLTPSEFVRQRYVDWGISAKKIRVQENGMPAAPPALPRRPDAGRRRTRFGFFGQLYRHKGVLLLLEAFEDLVARGTTDAELHLHGCLNAHHDPEFNQAFSQKLEETSAPVHFHGPYPSEQVTQLMESVDWVLVPSLWWENSPLTILEARSARRPVICGDIGGMAEKVRDGVTGLHFRTGDRSALTEVLDRAASTDGLWEELRENITPGPGSSEIGDELLAFYAALIEGRAAPTDLRTNALASPPNAEAPRIEAREPGEGASEDAPGRWLFTSPLIEQVGSETFLTGILEGPGLAERPPRAPRFVGLHWIPGGTAQPPLPSSEVEELLSGTQVHLPKAAGSGDEAPAVQVRLRLPLALASLPASAHLEVRVATEEGPPRPAASLRLDHTPLAPRTRERRTPILFSGIGRTGGTITFRHLLEHPEILVIPKYPYETRINT